MTSSLNTIHVGPSIKTLSLNIEGISLAKCQILSKLAQDEEIDVILLQETHIRNENDLNRRCTISGFSIIESIFHPHYGITTLVRDTISSVQTVHKSCEDDVEVIIISVSDIIIANIYKPPAKTRPNPPLPVFQQCTIYMGDFNSHHIDWGYKHNDENGNKICEWINLHNLDLIVDLKDRKTFRSAAHGTSSNPDLCIVSDHLHVSHEKLKREVLSGFPHTQHKPVLLTYGLSIEAVESLPICRWNFQKANWSAYSRLLDENLNGIPAKPDNYQYFVKAVHDAARKSIPRGYRETYIPGWDKTCEELYSAFNNNGDVNIGSDLINHLNNNRRSIWQRKTETMDFTHSSRKAWNLIKKLGVTKAQHQSKATL